MTVQTLRKAARMAVVRAKDGTYRVAGDTNIYKVFPSFMNGGWACDCVAQTKRCSHIHAVELHRERKGDFA